MMQKLNKSRPKTLTKIKNLMKTRLKKPSMLLQKVWLQLKKLTEQLNTSFDLKVQMKKLKEK